MSLVFFIRTAVLAVAMAASTAVMAQDPVSDSAAREKELELVDEVECPLEDAAVGAAVGIANTLLGLSGAPEATQNLGNVFPDGTFEITDWSDYPDLGAPRPRGPFRIVPKSEYDVDRDLANKSNARLRRIHRMKYSGQEIHEIKPVRFGGSPTDIGNKVALSREAHAEYTKWWRKIQRWAECRVKKMKKGRGR